MRIISLNKEFMEYLSVSQVAHMWGITPRRLQVLCNEGRVEGARKVGSVWTIPDTAEKPIDGRRKISNLSNPHQSPIRIDRIWAMPNKNTFDIKPINDLIRDEMTDGLWIDPFANKNKFASVTNDLNPVFDTNFHMDALDFLKTFDTNSVDGVLYDPPYSPRQVSECYNNVGCSVTQDTTKASFWSNQKKEISRIVKPGGKVISFGWNSGGIGGKYGFEIVRILLVPHGGWHNDTICTVEVKKKDYDMPSLNCERTDTDNASRSGCDSASVLTSELKKLSADYWDFKDADIREYTHGIHNYPAMMASPISRNIIRIMKGIGEIDTLLDPFSGSGTVLVEGMLAGIRKIYGNDINPLALFLSKVKTTPLDINLLQSSQEDLIGRIDEKVATSFDAIDQVDNAIKVEGYSLTSKEGWGSRAPELLEEYCRKEGVNIAVPHFKNIGYWFKPRVILLLSLIRSEIALIENADIRDFMLVALSETVRFVSNRRNGEFKMFRMPISKVENFKPDVIKVFRTLLSRNIGKMKSFVEALGGISNSEVRIFNTDAADLNGIKNESVDLVITSPPYGDSRTTVAYGEYSRLSLEWLGLPNISDKDIMGIDKSLMGGKKYRKGFECLIPSQTLKDSLEKIKQLDLQRAGDVYSFYLDLERVLGTVSNKTKSGGYHFWVVGNRTVKGELLKTDQILSEIALEAGLEHVCTINRKIVNKVMPSQNSPTNEIGLKNTTIMNEHIVILRKE